MNRWRIPREAIDFPVMVRSVAWAILAAALSVSAAEEGDADRAFLAGDYARAESLLEAETGQGDAKPARCLLLARARFLQGKWRAAQDVLDPLLKQDPENPAGRELLGRVLQRQGQYALALPYYEESLRQSDKPELRIELAEALVALNRRDEAVAQLKKVLADGKPWPKAHALLGTLRLESGLGHWAARDLWAALRMGCAEPGLRLKAALAFEQEGRITGPLLRSGPFPDKASGDRVGDLLLLRPAGGDGFWWAAANDCALFQTETCLAESPSDEVLLLASRCWLAAGDAARASERAGAAKAESIERNALRLRIALAREDLEAFRKLLEAGPEALLPAPEDRLRLLLDAALLAQVKGDLPVALGLLRQADRLLQGRSEVFRPLVDVLLRSGQKEEAEKVARALAELHPDSPEIRRLASSRGVDLEGMVKRGAPSMEEEEAP
jgi:tetratricopeptide (TPR) repeat protein